MLATVIFPHQLFEKHPALQKKVPVYLVEDPLYFTQYPFHRQKIILHRASMKYYAAILEKKGWEVIYVDHGQASTEKLFAQLAKRKVTEVAYADTTDYLLERRLKRYGRAHGIALTRHVSPYFLTGMDETQRMLGTKRKYLMASFYIAQRKRMNVLMTKGEPVGGKWSFDAENRLKMPKGLAVPAVYKPKPNAWVEEATAYTHRHFSKHYGQSEGFAYPTTHAEAQKVLEDFLEHRMALFGDYEDAIVANEQILFHSVLTPALNTGLLTPEQIVNTTLQYHQTKKYPLNSLEGFIRQVIGWREFMRGIYEREGIFLRTNNHWRLTRKIPASFYSGTTGIDPVDQTIKKVLATGYCHHIERLMILGNFMHLCGFDPDDVYRWFMELFIDAFDWVMVPNVYGMSQYADGGLITTKPYISGSNYVLKMSDYVKGPWCEVWDGLYWNYIYEHREVFAKNPRMSMVVNLVKKMDAQKLSNHLAVANRFLKSL